MPNPALLILKAKLESAKIPFLSLDMRYDASDIVFIVIVPGDHSGMLGLTTLNRKTETKINKSGFKILSRKSDYYVSYRNGEAHKTPNGFIRLEIKYA